MKKILIIFLLCPLLAFAQHDWKAEKKDNAVIYIPTDLQANKKFQFKFYKVNFNGLDKKTWLIQHAKKQESSLGKTIKNWKINSEKHGEWSTINQYISHSGKKFIIGYSTGTFSGGTPYILQMICSLDAELLMNYGLKIDELKPDAEKKLMLMQTHISRSKNTKIKTHNTDPKGLVSPAEFKKMTNKKRRQYVRKHIRTPPNKGLEPSKIKTVLTKLKIINGKLKSYTYILLKDGTVYGSCRIPIRDLNVKASRKLEGAAYANYHKWSRWKKQGGKYYFQNKKTNKWMLRKGLQKALPGKKGERLNNTFWTYSANEFSSHRGYYKFMLNGRFEIYNSSIFGSDMRFQSMDGSIPHWGGASTSDKKGSSNNSVIIGNNVGGGTSRQRKDGNKNTGTYYIDGYTIELHHDNGWVHRELFHFPEKRNKKYLNINDSIYWIDGY